MTGTRLLAEEAHLIVGLADAMLRAPKPPELTTDALDSILGAK